MVIGVQIIGILFALGMLYLTFLSRKREEFTIREFSVWTVVWLVFLLLTLFPDKIDSFVSSVGFARTLDAYIIVGFLFLISSMFYMYTLIRRVQNRTEQIVRNIALEKED